MPAPHCRASAEQDPELSPRLRVANIDISVVICCFNSADRLPPTLIALQGQRVPGINWEVVVVDNGSNDNTADVAKQSWMRAGVPIRIASAARAGVEYAREQGIADSRGRFILMCDDDNWLAPDYLAKACAILESDPDIGAVGGCGEPACESEAPAWLQQNLRMYATGPQSTSDGFVEELYGAGMVLRASALAELKRRGFEYALTSRTGARSTAGEDTEICYALRLIGYNLWYSRSLKFKHAIRTDRLKSNYVAGLYARIGYAYPLLHLYRAFLRAKRYRLSALKIKGLLFVMMIVTILRGAFCGLLLRISREKRLTEAYRNIGRSAAIAYLQMLWMVDERRHYQMLYKRLKSWRAVTR